MSHKLGKKKRAPAQKVARYTSSLKPHHANIRYFDILFYFSKIFQSLTTHVPFSKHQRKRNTFWKSIILSVITLSKFCIIISHKFRLQKSTKAAEKAKHFEKKILLNFLNIYAFYITMVLYFKLYYLPYYISI